MTERPGSHRRDLGWLLLAGLVMLGAGLGLRDPWPADEPRFVLIARDMLAGGEWLFPHVGADLYADKPPPYFWLLAATLGLTGWPRAFPLPSLLAGLGVLALTWDLSRRLHGRAAALAAGGTLLVTVQFLLVFRSAQIDATLGLLTTLSLYGLCRHLLLGPAWGWYVVGAFAAGLGVVTKGVGFLPLLLLVPWWLMRRRGWQGVAPLEGGPRWWLALPAFVVGTAVWLLPLALRVLSEPTPTHVAYVREILLGQTVTRYAAAWHHREPFYYYLTQLPGLWLPWTVLAFWLVPRWRADWVGRQARTLLLLAWVLVVFAFFSASTGKRGIYMAPALPALALAAAPHLPALWVRPGVGRAARIAAGMLALLAIVVAVLGASGQVSVVRLLERAGLDVVWPLAVFAVLAAAAGLATRRRPVLAWPWAVGALALAWGFLLVPAMDETRSGRGFMRRVLAEVPGEVEVGLVGWKEQFLLQATRPVVEFGHRRWREGAAESHDAARWLNEAPARVLLVPGRLLAECFDTGDSRALGRSAGDDWYLVEAPAREECARQGEPGRGRLYLPPAARAGVSRS